MKPATCLVIIVILCSLCGQAFGRNDTAQNATKTNVRLFGKLGPINATFILVCTFLIFTMQSGFGLLESGSVSSKNEVNIMFKNGCDLIIGGTVYWLVGYGLAFGESDWSNPVFGWGDWALAHVPTEHLGDVHTFFIFQLAFAGTAETIVSGAVAERIQLHSYMILVVINSLLFAVVSHWYWATNGWLYKLGVVDIAGAGAVHCCGGATALVSAYMLGPRTGRYDTGSEAPPIGNGLNIFLGAFFLWWGWLAFNCGSVYGAQNGLWVSIAKTAENTMLGSFGGAIAGLSISLIQSKGAKFRISDLTNGILGGLVGITGACTVIAGWEAFLCGFIGAIVVLHAITFMDYLQIDDPVGAIGTHGCGGIWGMIVVGLFMDDDPISKLNKGKVGLFHGGGLKPLGVQLLAIVSVIAFCSVWTFLTVYVLSVSPLKYRLSLREELLGADAVEHDIDKDTGLLSEFSNSERFYLEHTIRASTLTGAIALNHIIRERSTMNDTLSIGSESIAPEEKERKLK